MLSIINALKTAQNQPNLPHVTQFRPEPITGTAGSNCRENAERLRVFLSGGIDVVPFDEEDAAAAGDLRAALETAGTPIGLYDLSIAAQALRSRTTSVTANVSEFARVRGLNGEDWTAGAP